MERKTREKGKRKKKSGRKVKMKERK